MEHRKLATVSLVVIIALLAGAVGSPPASAGNTKGLIFSPAQVFTQNQGTRVAVWVQGAIMNPGKKAVKGGTFFAVFLSSGGSRTRHQVMGLYGRINPGQSVPFCTQKLFIPQGEFYRADIAGCDITVW